MFSRLYIIKLITAVIYRFHYKLECLYLNTRQCWESLPGTNTLAYNSIECRFAECRDYLNVMLSVVMLNVIILSVITLNVIMLNVVVLSVVAPRL